MAKGPVLIKAVSVLQTELNLQNIHWFHQVAQHFLCSSVEAVLCYGLFSELGLRHVLHVQTDTESSHEGTK